MLVFQYWMPFFAPCFAFLGFLTRQMLGARVIYVCHNIIPHEKKPGDRLLNRLGLAFVDGFIVQSKAVLKDLLNLRIDAVYREVPHPVYEIFPPPIPKDKARKALAIREERVLLYFGNIRAYKGLPYLIRAMPEILDHFPVRLLVCGEFYEERAETMRLIERLDVGSAVTVYDRFIPNEEVQLFFCASDLVVLPYVSATQSGIVQIAYYYDKPVVVTRVGGLPEVVIDGKSGYVVAAKNAAGLAEAVVDFYRESRGKALVRGVKKEKHKYSWDRMVDAVEAF
jgi:glycosyltransferase involved in cell wall biosynthesis